MTDSRRRKSRRRGGERELGSDSSHLCPEKPGPWSSRTVRASRWSTIQVGGHADTILASPLSSSTLIKPASERELAFYQSLGGVKCRRSTRERESWVQTLHICARRSQDHGAAEQCGPDTARQPGQLRRRVEGEAEMTDSRRRKSRRRGGAPIPTAFQASVKTGIFAFTFFSQYYSPCRRATLLR
jgi:hypothetical protein